MYLCDQCGNLQTQDVEEPYKTCRKSGGRPCAGCQSLENLNARITEAKTALEDLLHERRLLKSSINHMHKSLVGSVPTEVISSIFEHFVLDWDESLDDLDDDDYFEAIQNRGPSPSPLTLGAVCRAWRHIAWSTPEIWTHLFCDIDLLGKAATLEEAYALKAELASEWLARSRTLPLHLALYASPRLAGYPEVQSLVRPIFDVINRYSTRCRVLSLQFPAKFLSQFVAPSNQDAHLVGYPMLKKLNISNNSGIFNPDYEFNLEKERSDAREVPIAPRFVDVSCIPIHNVNIDWKNVVHVCAEVTDQDDFYMLLQYAPQLEICRFSASYFSGTVRAVIHPKLEILDIESPFLEDILPSITLPGLRTLKFDLKGRLLPAEQLLHFLARSGAGGPGFLSFGSDGQGGDFTVDDMKSELQYLLISQTKFSNHGADLVQICRATPNLIKLCINLVDEDKSLDALYLALANGPTPSSNVPPFLPKLESLEIVTTKGSNIAWGLIPEFLQSFDDGSRQCRPLSSVTIECIQGSDSEPTVIDQKNVSRLQQLIRDGVALDAFETRGDMEIDLIPME